MLQAYLDRFEGRSLPHVSAMLETASVASAVAARSVSIFRGGEDPDPERGAVAASQAADPFADLSLAAYMPENGGEAEPAPQMDGVVERWAQVRTVLEEEQEGLAALVEELEQVALQRILKTAAST